MRRLLPTVLLVAMLLHVAACQRTVSPEGYVSETPVERYVRNIPKAYAGKRPVVLKPPVAQAPAPSMAAPQYYVEPATTPMMGGADYTSQPLAAPVMMPPPVVSAPMTPPGDWNTLPSYNGSMPAQDLSRMNTGSSYAPSPVVSNMMMPPQQQIAAPSAIITREVDYGREITVYPLDRADAPMPYIPPATTYEQPPVKVYKKQAPAGLND